jgi:hypothetical protein
MLIAPLAVLLTMVFDRWLASPISRISTGKWLIFKPLRFFGLDNLRYLKKKKFNSRFLLISFYSSILGGITHLLLDLPTHNNIALFYPWVIITPSLIQNVVLNIGTLTFFNFQIAIKFYLTRRLWDLFLIPITLYLMRYIKTQNLVLKLGENKQSIRKFKNQTITTKCFKNACHTTSLSRRMGTIETKQKVESILHICQKAHFQ